MSSTPLPRSVSRSLMHWCKLSRAALAASALRRAGIYDTVRLGAVVSAHAAAYLQIGDGAIVVATEEPGEYTWVFWPQHGEYANSTYFLTQDAASEALMFETGPPVQEVAIFSDGIERLVLDMVARTVHSPAFRPVFQWLAKTAPEAAQETGQALAAYLSSDHVTSRTDDDKTLVMATRVSTAGLQD